MVDRIVTVVFDDGMGHGDWHRLCAAFEASVRTNVPYAELVIIEGQRPPAERNVRQSFKDNTHKLDLWAHAVDIAEDGDRVLLADCDALVLGDVFAAFGEGDFDIAYTVRPSPHRINGGMIYLRVSDKTRRFMREWVRINAELMADDDRRKPLIDKHAGINQAAINVLLDNGAADCETAELPCAKWNNVCQTREQFGDDTMVLHVMGTLRELLLANAPMHRRPPYIRPAFDVWMQYDQLAKESECLKAQANTATG
jgi:hypothetical protein